jgi:hypothetical protein
LRLLFINLGLKITNNTTIFSDNRSNIVLVKNPKFHIKTKHIELQHHFVRKKLKSGDVHLTFCSTEKVLVDLLTKGLSKLKHVKYINSINVFSIVEQEKV